MFKVKSKRVKMANKIMKKLSKVFPDYEFEFHPKTGYRFYLDLKTADEVNAATEVFKRLKPDYEEGTISEGYFLYQWKVGVSVTFWNYAIIDK